MSERMTNVEIEDVLSSIRRLVSDDPRPGDAFRFVSTRGAAAGKLLLTPALRIVPDADATEPDALARAVARSNRTEPMILNTPVTEPSIERVVSVVGAAVARQTQDWEAEDDAVPEAPHTFTDAAWAEEWEASEPWAEDAGDAAPLGRSVEPVWDEAEQALADRAEAEAIAEICRTPDLAIAPAAGSALAVQDETLLRDLVREMIRAELQGPLGERITRNVRKLVRAEINRALITRDLD